MKVGITGGSGVLGKVLIDNIKDIEWINFNGDISDIHFVNNWINTNNTLDAIIHLAAIVSNADAISNPSRTIEVNVVGTTNLLQSIGLSNKIITKPWIFIASSAHVYLPSHNRLQESSQLGPISLYGMSKLQAEQISKICSELYGLKICIGRICSFTSYNQPKSFLIPALIEKISNSPKNSKLFIPGLMGIRDFLSIYDICSAIEILLLKMETGTYNISSGKPVKLIELAFKIRDRLKRNDLIIETNPDNEISLVLDNTKLVNAGFIPKSDMEKVLNEIICSKNIC